ncbi:MAG: hypothetical protein ACXVEE_28140 [Polyangiales bacterium]
MLEDLRKAALASPRDDAPLLVIADRFLERGITLGELIHLQCKRAQLADDHPDRSRLETREKELIAADAAKWLGPAWHSDIEFEFVRGVPTGRFGHAGLFMSEISGAGTPHPSRVALRVYPYGWAFTVAVVAHPGAEKGVAMWLDDKHPIVARGAVIAQWRDDGLALAFESRSSHGVVKYEGLLREGHFECATHSLINGHRATSRFTLTPVDGCDTRPSFALPPEDSWDGRHDGYY